MGNRHENICSLIITESVNIDGILAQQRLAWTALEQKRAELQITLSSKKLLDDVHGPVLTLFLDKQKKFREEANFCKVSFREYDEQVCDITKYVQKY